MSDQSSTLSTWLAALSASDRAVLAQLWNVPDPTLLDDYLHQPAVIVDLIAHLAPLERAALERVQAAGGTLAAVPLEREYGPLRPHSGFASPRAYMHALQGEPSPVERLFVLGLLHRSSIADTPCYSIPPEWLTHLPPLPTLDATPHIAGTDAPAYVEAADVAMLERDLVTLLALAHAEPLMLNANGTFHRSVLTRAAERLQLDGPAPTSEHRWPELGLQRMLALELNVLHERRGGLRVAPDALIWLELPATQRRQSLLQAWLASPWDELAVLCDLRWRTPPLTHPGPQARRRLLDFVRAVAPDDWFAIDPCVAELQRVEPEWARVAADFDAWQLSGPGGALLTGFAHWMAVEGALARALLIGPLHWLGLLDVGGSGEPSHVRLSAWGRFVLERDSAPLVAAAPLMIAPTGQITVDALVPPLPRFQVSRVAHWHGYDDVEGDIYQLTARSFDEAVERGIGRVEMVRFLERWSEAPLPVELARTLCDWEAQRRALRGRTVVLLEADDPHPLAAIVAQPDLHLPPYEALDSQHWLIEPGDATAFVHALRDAGYGLATTLEAPDTPLTDRDLQALLTTALICSSLAANHQFDLHVPAALLNRVRRILPSAARTAAEQAARATLHSLGYELES